MKPLTLPALCCGFMACACMLPASSRGYHADDSVTTSVLIPVDKGTTKTVPLRPLRRARYLERRIHELPAMNRRIIRSLLEYPRDGTHGYWWPRERPSPYDGSTTDVVLQGATVMRGEKGRQTFCCGVTLEVCYNVLLQARKLPPGLTAETAEDFMKLWFCTHKGSAGPAEAMEKYGIGRRINRLKDVLPGDFMQIWRADGTGHSVIFVAWALDRDGRRVGMHYWSSQAITDGINFHAEPIGHFGKVIDLRKTYFVRMNPPGRWIEPATPGGCISSLSP